jgi:hypothetical protein
VVEPLIWSKESRRPVCIFVTACEELVCEAVDPAVSASARAAAESDVEPVAPPVVDEPVSPDVAAELPVPLAVSVELAAAVSLPVDVFEPELVFESVDAPLVPVEVEPLLADESDVAPEAELSEPVVEVPLALEPAGL